MEMIWHNHVRADPCPMRRTLLTKLQKTFVDSYSSQKFASILCAGCDEVDRRTHEHRIKTTQAVLSIFGGHRPPLQFLRPQRRLADRRMFVSCRWTIQSARNQFAKVRDVFGDDCFGRSN